MTELAKRIYLNRLVYNSSRLEEIAHLEKYLSIVDDQTYLSQLFTPEFMTWVRYQIENDHCPDIYAEWKLTEHNYSESTVFHKKWLREAQELRTINKDILEKLEDVHKQNSNLELSLDHLQKEYDKCADYIERLEKAAEIDSLKWESERQGLAQELIQLKAKLYDFEHGVTNEK